MWFFWLALLIAIAFACSFLAPSSGLHASALRAFEASVSELSRGGSDEGDEPGIVEAISAPASPLRSVRSAPTPTPPLKTSNIRKRVTPLMQKRVAAICGLLFTDTSLWEMDHIEPLSSAKTAADVARLNDISNLQPVHRSPCHQMKTSREAAAR